MARETSLLTSTTPVSIAKTKVHIGHVQLRDLVICPRDRGVVNYVQHQAIVEHNLQSPGNPRTLVDLAFTPNTLTSLPIEGSNQTLIAAGGQEAEVHLSLHASSPSRPGLSSLLWQWETRLNASINNSVLLTSLSLNRSYESSVEPRIAISNNDCTVKFYDIPMRTPNSKRILTDAGTLKLEVPVNHSSISPDGRTLLSVGDCNKVWLHQLNGGARLTFTPISTLQLPEPNMSPHFYSSPSLAASFSTAFSKDGSKFVIGSQEGVVAIWDVRSTKSLKVFHTDKSRVPCGRDGGIGGGSGHVGNGSAVDWLSDDPWEWTREQSKAPGWSVRNVKFAAGGHGYGKEIMAFTEHTALIHIVDARTFEHEEIIRVPAAGSTARRTPPSSRRTSSTSNLYLSPQQLQQQLPPTQRRIRYSAGPGPTRPAHHHRHHAQSHSLPHLHHSHSHMGHGGLHHPTIVQALGETFRIPGSSSSSASGASPDSRGTTSGGAGVNVNANLPVSEMTAEEAWRIFGWGVGASSQRGSGRDGDRGEGGAAGAGAGSEEDILVIPSLGMGGVESDVQALLSGAGGSGRRGIWRGGSPGAEGSEGGRSRGRGDDVMEDDEGDDDGDGDGDVYHDPNTGSTHGDYEYVLRRSSSRRAAGFVGGGSSRTHDADEDMEIDELAESECGSSRTPSPSPSSSRRDNNAVVVSPPAAPIIPAAVLPPQVVPRLNHSWTMGSAIGASGSGTGFLAIQSPPPRQVVTLTPRPSSTPTNNYRSGSGGGGVSGGGGGGARNGGESKSSVNYERDLDLAGICFDPSGAFLYAATKESVGEWRVRGGDKRWWAEGRWA